ncbi:MAG: hypothetical protein QOJ25_98 [Solirubrobacteraceae bacterium]|jgi:hypothetical protein|nr:hypothetical protein [Solirubrobacteraceae bacterium]
MKTQHGPARAAGAVAFAGPRVALRPQNRAIDDGHDCYVTRFATSTLTVTYPAT